MWLYREQIAQLNAQNLRSEIEAKTTHYFATAARSDIVIYKVLVVRKMGMIFATKRRAAQAAIYSRGPTPKIENQLWGERA